MQNLLHPGSEDARPNWGKSRENFKSRAEKTDKVIFQENSGKICRKSRENAQWTSGRELVTRVFKKIREIILGQVGKILKVEQKKVTRFFGRWFQVLGVCS